MHEDTLKKKEHSEKTRKMADSSFKNNDLQEAARLYELSIKKNSNNVKALNNFAALSETLGNKKKAEYLYKLACDLPETSASDKLKFHQNLASIQETNGKINAALWTYQLTTKIEGFTKSTIAFNYLDLLQSIQLTSFDAATFASLTSLFNTEGIDHDALARVYFSQLALKLAKTIHTKEDYSAYVLDIIESEQIALELMSRALGNRSIIAAPFSVNTTEKLNSIKKREHYRPVAPICLEEDAKLYFENCTQSKFMLSFHNVIDKRLKAVTHTDGTARVQTVSLQDNIKMHKLLLEFKKQSGVSVLCNTSLNFKGKGFINTFSDLESFCSTNNISTFVVDNVMYQAKGIEQ